MSRGFRLEAVLLVRDMCAAPKAGSPGRHLMLSVADFDMWLDVRSWHIADMPLALTNVPAIGGKADMTRTVCPLMTHSGHL
jgi:hypothetical protein